MWRRCQLMAGSRMKMHPAVWPSQTWAENGGLCPLFGEGSWIPIQQNVAGDEAYLHAKCHLDPSSRLATIDMGRKLCPLLGELGPHLAQYGLGRGLPPYQVASLSIQPFAHNRHGPKMGALSIFWRGELGPHLTQCRLGRGLPSYQVAS